MTTDRNKLLAIAGHTIKHVEGHGWTVEPPNASKWVAFDGTPAGDFFAALLQAQGEPQSSDQVWNEACEALKAKLVDRMRAATDSTAKAAYANAENDAHELKRPSQAQEPSPNEPKPCRECDPSVGVVCDSCASVSGAVDEREEIEPSQEILASLDKVLSRAQATQPAQQIEFVDQWGCRHTLSLGAAAKELKSFYDAWPGGLQEINSALNTALKQPAQQAPAVSDEQLLKIGQKHGMTVFKDVAGGKWLFVDSMLQEDFIALCRELLSQPAAAPVSEQAVPQFTAADALRQRPHMQHLNAAPSNQSQGGDK